MDARQDGAQDEVLDHVQELSAAEMPGMDAVALFPWGGSCQGLSAAEPIPWFSDSPVQQAALMLLLPELGWGQF